MESLQIKELAALLHSLLALSGSPQEEILQQEQTRFISRLCSRYDALPEVKDIALADPLREFAGMTDRHRREEFMDILLSFVEQQVAGKMDRERWLYLARLLMALDG